MRSTILAAVLLVLATSVAGRPGTRGNELADACALVQRIARDGDAVQSAPKLAPDSANLQALRTDLEDAAHELAALATEMSDRGVADAMAAVAHWNLTLEPPAGVEQRELPALASEVVEVCRWSGHDIGSQLGPASLLYGNLLRRDG